MPDEKKPWEMYGNKTQEQKPWESFKPIKKKETTVSPSVPKKQPISSVTPPKGPQKPLVSSVSGKDEGLYKFPGNEQATYKKQAGQWYVDPSGSGKFTKLYKGDVEERVKLLESKAVPYSGKKQEEKIIKPEIVYTDGKSKRSDVFSGVPGMEDKKYRLDTSSGVPVWMEYGSSVSRGQGAKREYDIYDKQITDPTRVQYLNKLFKQNASTSEAEKIYVGYPGKEKNEYRIKEGIWQRRQPGQDDWTNLHSKASITSLNNQFNQNVKYDAARDKFSGVSEDVQLKEKKYVDQNINSINSKLIGQEEDEVIKNLKQKFPDFKFGARGLLTDELMVQAPNGEFTTISLDNFTDENDNAQAQKLRGFIRTNSSKKLAAATSSLEEAERENEIKSGINVNMRRAKPGDKEYIFGVAENMQPYVQDVSFVSKEEKYKKEVAEKAARKEYAKQTSLVFADVYDRQKQSLKEGSKIDDKEVIAELAALPKSNDAIRRANEYANDVNKSFKSYNSKIKELNIISNDVNQKLQSGEISEEEFNQVYKPQIEAMSNDIKTMGDNLKVDAVNLKNIDKSVNESVANQYIIDEAQGSFGGGIAYKFIKGMTYIPRLISPDMTKEDQEALVRTIVGGGTTQQYIESEKRSDIVKTLFSLSESMGALASGSLLGGGPATYAAFYGQSYYEMKDDLDQIKDMSDTSKVLMSSIYGAASSVLEKFGIDFAMQKTRIGKNLTNSIMKSVFSELPKNASKEFIEASIMNNAKMFLRQAGIKTAGAFALEGGTEGLQALTQVGIKEVYDQAKGTDYFNNKSGWEILGDIAYEAYLGALGGGIMGTVSQSKSIIDRGVNVALNKDQLDVLFNSAKMDGIPEALLTNLKSSIISGKISKDEAQNIYNSYNEVKSKIQSIPEEYSVENKSIALDLMLEKDRINKQIAGKDANLVKPQLDRIAEINNQLKTIGENAVKESTKPVEEVTAEGGGVQYQGTQEGQPEVREGERTVGQAAQPEADLGDRAVEGRGVQEERVTRQIVNRPAVLSEFGGKTFDTPLKGDVYVEGQQVIFEDRSTGRMYELGNVDEVMDTQVPGLSVEQERVAITPEGKVSIEGSNWNIQSELPTQGIEYNPAGEVMTVSLKDDAGNTKMFKGQDAVDIAYQIELQKYQTEEQQQFINDLLEQDEEFKAATESIKPAEVAAVVQEEAAPDIVPAQPAAVEEAVTAEQLVAEEAAVDEEVERLGRLLEGTDEQIDEQVGKLRISKDNNKVAQSISNAAKAIAKILPDVKFVVHDTDESYRKATGEQNRKQSTAGEYNPKTRTIHINGTKANNRTAPHEVFHAVILEGVKNDAEAQRLTKAMINAVMKSLVNVDGVGKVISYLKDFSSNYEQNIQNEEKLAELFGILADNYATLPAPTQSLIRRFLDRLAKIFGLKPLTDREVIDFMNVVSQKVARGKEIQTKEIIGISKQKEAKTARKQMLAPNGKPSNLNEKQWNQVRTPEFKKWFGDWENDPENASKVVDENGEPLVVYHGTPNYIEDEIFYADKENTHGVYTGKIWFTSNKKVAIEYSKANDKGYIPYPLTNDLKYLIDKGIIRKYTDGKLEIKNIDKLKGYNITELSLNQMINDYNDKNENRKEKYKEQKENRSGLFPAFIKAENKDIQRNVNDYPNDIFGNEENISILSDIVSVDSDNQIMVIESKQPVVEEEKSIRKQIDNSFEARNQKPISITDIINAARQNGFSDAAIQQYLSQQGYNQQQITNAMVSVNPSGVTIDDVFKKSQEELESKLKSRSIKQRIVDALRSTRGTMLNRQTDIKRALRGIKNKEAKQTYAKLVDKAGASGFAALRFKIVAKKIYGKLKESEIKALDSIIYARRVTSINENRRKINSDIYEGLTPGMANELDIIITAIRNNSKKDLSDAKKRLGDKTYKDLINRAKKYRKPYTGISIEVEVTDANGNTVKEKRSYNESDAQRDLVNKRAELGDKKFDDLNRRADIYFGVFEENLKKLKDSGRISEETYNNLKDVEYSPIKTIKYILKDNYDPNDLDKEASRLGISKKDIMSLGDENENGIITDSRWLLMMNLNTVESRVFENRMLNELVSAIENATAQEKVALSDYFILDNPIIGQFKDGRPKRRFDDEALPDGYTRVHYFKDGIDNYIIAKEAIAKQILDVKNSKITPTIEQFNEDVPILGWLVKQLTLTPGRLLRFFATGSNPFFIIVNVPIDWANAVFLNQVYSHKWYEQFKVISGVNAAWGFVKNFTKSAISKGEWNKIYMEYAEHGGLMETMNQESMRALQEMKPTGRLAKKLPKKIRPAFKTAVSAPYKLLEAYGKASSYLGETSEIAMRLAVYEKMKKNLIDDYKKANNGIKPTGKDLDDIMWESAREARELIDFNQGGSWSKEIDVLIPYFNPSMQGLRKPLDYARENPVGFASSMVQLALMGGSIAILSVASGLSSFDDEDEEERKKKLRKALDSITAREKANYHIIFTGKKDKDGELQYIRIKKLPIASIITTAAENLVYQRYIEYNNKETQSIVNKSAIPILPSEIFSKNPLISGILTYAYNEDTYTGEKVFREPKNKKILPTAEGMFDDKVEGIYKTLAPSLGLSPARSKAFVEKFITNESVNPTINIIYAALNGVFDKGTTFGDEFGVMTEELLKHSSRKFIRNTNKDIIKYNLQDEFEKKEMKRETEIYLKEQKMYNDIKKIYDDKKSLTVGELENMVKNNFDVARQKSELKKYYSFIQNMNMDRSLLDIVYEDNPEVQSMRIYERYGNSIDKQEVEELSKIIDNTGKRINKRTWYYYEKDFNGKIK